MKTTTYTASKGKKKLVNITFADAREYASIGGWKVTGFDKMKTKLGFGKEKNLMKINPSGKGWHFDSIRHQNAAKLGIAGPLYKKNPEVRKKGLRGKKKPYFIKEPYGLPFELTKAGEFRKLNPMEEKRAKEILGDRASWELKNMKRALESFPILNTPEENERLEAVKTMIRSKQRKSNPRAKKTYYVSTKTKTTGKLRQWSVKAKNEKDARKQINKKKFSILVISRSMSSATPNPREKIEGKITIHKSKYDWDKKHPWIVAKGDLRASFATEREAKVYAKKQMPYAYFDPVTFIPKYTSQQRKSNPQNKATTLDFPKQKSSYNTHITVYVPSTKNKNKKISASHYNKRIKEVQNFLTKKWGGTTQVSGVGTYTDSKGNLIGESVAKVEVFTQPKDYNKFDQDVKKFIERKRKSWGQETMLFTYESKNRPAEGAYLVPYAK